MPKKSDGHSRNRTDKKVRSESKSTGNTRRRGQNRGQRLKDFDWQDDTRTAVPHDAVEAADVRRHSNELSVLTRQIELAMSEGAAAGVLNDVDVAKLRRFRVEIWEPGAIAARERARYLVQAIKAAAGGTIGTAKQKTDEQKRLAVWQSAIDRVGNRKFKVHTSVETAALNILRDDGERLPAPGTIRKRLASGALTYP